MLTDQSAEILKLAAGTENTPELQAYWKKRYEELYTQNLFTLSPRTEEMVLSQAPADKPSTAFGELNLVSHLDTGNNFDEVKLQTTIESSIRLLDSLLDVIKFTTEAHRVINQYRKIGLGISNFKDYLAVRKPSSELDEIDYIGNLISSYCYRASESLAEEKGTCGSWDKIKTHLRAKSFEYWYNTDNGEIKNGLEMSEEFDEASLKNGNWQIVPRRNSHILLFPAELEWQIWSDRDETSPPTEISPAPQDQVSTPSAPVQQETVEITPPLQEPSPQVPAEHYEPAQELIEEPVSVPEVNLVSQAPEVPAPQIEPLIPSEEQGKSGERLQIPVLQEETPAQPSSNGSGSLHFDLRPVKPNGSGDETPAIQPSAEPETGPSAEAPAAKSEAQFQVGELVQISNPQSKFQNQVFQVGEISSLASGHEYKLIGHDEVEGQIWAETDLRAVDLFDILDKINLNPNIAGGGRRVVVHALLPGAQEQILVHSENGTTSLPGGELPWNEAPEQGLLKILSDKYNLKVRIADDLGSSLELGGSPEQTSIHLAFLVEGEFAAHPELKMLKMTLLGELPTYLQILINKFNRRQIMHANWAAKVQSLEAGHARSIQELQAKLEEQRRALQEAQNVAYLQRAATGHPQHGARADQQPVPSQFKVVNESTTNSNMSKYALKLEQLVQTNAFGDVAVTLQYDAQGPRMVTLNSDKLDGELKHLLDTILSILNFMLVRQITPSEIAALIEKEPQDGVHLPINDLLKVVAASLKEAPATVNNINPEILEDVVPAIQEIAKSSPRSEDAAPQAPAAPAAPEAQAKPKEEPRPFNPFGRS